MTCDRHALNLHWTAHHWLRRVSATQDQIGRETDMWGRTCDTEQVACRITQICETCGATVDGGECACEKSRAERCARRLAYLKARP